MFKQKTQTKSETTVCCGPAKYQPMGMETEPQDMYVVKDEKTIDRNVTDFFLSLPFPYYHPIKLDAESNSTY